MVKPVCPKFQIPPPTGTVGSLDSVAKGWAAYEKPPNDDNSSAIISTVFDVAVKSPFPSPKKGKVATEV